MACKNMTEALLEDVIEITWMFDGLIKAGEIKSWDEIISDECGTDGVKNVIKDIAQKFEEKYPFDTTWEDSNLDYIEEIEKFSRNELTNRYKKDDMERIKSHIEMDETVIESCSEKALDISYGICR